MPATPEIRGWFTLVHELVGRHADGAPLKKAAAGAVVANPFAGRIVDDVSDLIGFGAELGARLGERVATALGEPVESYGKAGLAGVGGEQEHAVAVLTTVFGDALRAAVGGGKAWIPSTTKVGGPGTVVDIPLAHKDALYVRSHYDTVTVSVPGSPLPDELVALCAVASRGRLNARTGGLAANEIEGTDGLR